MAQTIIGLNDAKAVKRYSGNLAVDVGRKGYFSRKFMSGGEVPTTPIWRLTDLESQAGELITYDLSMQLRMQPVEGDAVLEGKEEKLEFYTDSVYIDQLRGGADTGGRMTAKRTLHKLREVAKTRQTDWWARVFDEIFFMYLSGSRGTNSEYVFPVGYTGFANNSFTAPDSEHLIYGGNATEKADVDAADTMNLAPIDKAVAYAETMGGGVGGTPQLQPIQIDGESHYVCVMSSFQAYDLRASTGAGGWMDIQKALAAAVGKDSAICKGGLGMHNNVILHSHPNVVKFTDYGAANPPVVEAHRALFMGTQAAVCAFGSPGTGLRFGWHEETRDNGNRVVISTNTIVGVKKVTFNSKDFGVIAIDTAAKKP